MFRFVTVGLMSGLFCIAHADIKLPPVFSDHMVLQRDIALPVWGSASPGAEVTVEFAGQTKSGVAGDSGKWQVTLDPIPASSKPRKFRVSSSGFQVSFSDVLVGEVWLCSGQSNMQFPLTLTDGGKEAVENADMDSLRLFMMRPMAEDNFVQTLRVKTSEFLPSGSRSLSEPRTIFRGEWVPCRPGEHKVSVFSGVGFYFGRRIHEELNVPVGLIQMAQGGTPAESWVSETLLKQYPELNYIYERQDRWEKERPSYQKKFEEGALASWKEAVDAATAAGTKKPQPPYPPKELRPNWLASSLYNVLVCPLSPYAMRGVIWYQGESNEADADRYKLLFPLLINNWRQIWCEGDFPFYFVQLPNYGRRDSGLSACPWAELREAQLQTYRSVTNTGMAVTIDVGDARNVHPTNKTAVGNRLALWALADTYGQKDLVFSGPLFRSAEFMNDRVVIHFDFIGDGLVVQSEMLPGSVELAADDGTWHPARSEVTNDTLIVWYDSLESPSGVRYAWAESPESVGLYNRNGLPSSPFRAWKEERKND